MDRREEQTDPLSNWSHSAPAHSEVGPAAAEAAGASDSLDQTQSVDQELSTLAGEGGSGGGAPPIFSPGEVVAGRYRIVSFLARGGMGEVYEAEDLELEGSVALKTIRQQLAKDERVVERFRREIHLSRRVTHPNVCRIFDVFRHRKRLPGDLLGAESEITFLTMELLRGETVATRLARAGALSTTEAFPLARQMAEALAAAHRAGVVHRDFKSRNVVLEPKQSNEQRARLRLSTASPERRARLRLSQEQGAASEERTESGQLVASALRVVVTDFGLASAAAGQDFSRSLTASGDMVGTPAYMAPEQVEGGEVGAPADLYSLGVVMYEMVTGRKPFLADTAFATAVLRLTEAPLPPSRHVPGLDPKWERIILRLLERKPEDRFPSAAAVVSELDAGKARPLRPRKPNRVRKLAATAVLLALAGLSGWWLAPQIGGLGPHALAPESARRAVAVLGFKNLSGSQQADWLSVALSEMLGSELGAGGQLRIIPGEHVARMKIELGLGESESLDEPSLGQIRDRLGTDYVVIGSYVALGPPPDRQIRLDLRLQDAATQETMAVIATGTERQLLDLVVRASAQLREKLGVSPLSRKAESLRRE